MTSQQNPLNAGVDIEWTAAVRTRANILVSGDPARLDEFWNVCLRQFEEPIERYEATACLVLPVCRTLVLVGVEGLGMPAQNMLKEWLDALENRRTQVISLTTTALFNAVVDGRFDSSLFYRLNTIHLRLG